MRRIVWLALIFVMALSSNVWASGKITIDPNAGVGRAQVEEWSADTRLAQKVTYEARHKAVKAILADLSEMTGITFNAGYNKKDWQVRDRKMNIFAKDIVLADLMSSIARVMKFKWSVNKDEMPWTYRLYMDRKTLTSANAELSKAQDALDREIDRRRENFLSLFENWDDDISADELADLRNENPYLYMLHVQGIGRLMKGVINDIPEFRETFLGRKNDMGPNVSLFSPETQDALLFTAKECYKLKNDSIPGAGELFPEDYAKDIGKGAMLLDIGPDELGWKAYEFSKQAGIGLYINKRWFPINGYLGDPSDPLVQAKADITLQAIDKGLTYWQMCDQTNVNSLAHMEETKTLEKYSMIEPQPEVADESGLHKKFKIVPEHKPNQWPQLVDCQAALAETSGLSLVSDSYKSTWGYAPITEDEKELKDFLKCLGESYRYNWDKHGSILEMRSKDWFKRRATQIPDEWIEKWKADMKKVGYLPLEDEAQICALTTPQIEENIGMDETLWQISMFRSGSREVWLARLYASLDSDQRKALFSEVGLSTLCFDPDQLRIMHMFYEKPHYDPNIQPTQLLCSQTEPTRYVFSLVDTQADRVLEKWGIRLLAYKEPEKPATEEKKVEEKKTEEKKTDSASTSAEPAKK
jgi:hypothetical protein